MVPLEVFGGFGIVFTALLAVLMTMVFLKNICCIFFSGSASFRPRKLLLLLVPVYMLLILGLSVFASLPSFDKAAGPLNAAINPHPIAPYAPSLHEEFPGITIVTFSSDGYTDALENAIGSFHVWARGVPIAVYDMGLSHANIARIRLLANVQVIPFNFSKYPPHVRYMHNYAFKPLLMLDAVERFGAILSLDAGVELRQAPRVVFEAIHTVGYFFVEASEADPLTRVNPKTVAYLQLPAPRPEERQCYAGMQGYRRGFVVEHVLRPSVACALDPACIDPPGSGHENHRYEQVVLSLFMRKNGVHCSVGRLFNEHLPTTLHPDPLTLHQPQLFFFRRWRYPKPYAPLALRITPGGQVVGTGQVGSEGEESEGLFENGVTDRKTSDVKFVQCLQENAYNTALCEKLQAAWRGAAAGRAHLGSAEYRETQERHGWWLSQAARVYWLWPFSLTEAAVVVALSTVALVCWMVRPQTPIAPLVLLAALLAVMIFRFSAPRLCSPGQHVSFSSLASQDPFLLDGRSRVQCPDISHATRPFLLRDGTQQYVFFAASALEHSVVSYGVAPSTPDGAWVVGGAALVSPIPLTRPCVFSHNGTHFMLPVMPDSNRVQLFTTVSFPTGWHVIRDLLTLPAPVAAMIYEFEGHWWLLVTTDRGRTSQLHVSRHLLGPYQPAARAPILPRAAAVCHAPEGSADELVVV